MGNDQVEDFGDWKIVMKGKEEITYILKRIFLGLREEEVYRWEDYQSVQSGEEGVCTPSDVCKHWSCSHDDLDISCDDQGKKGRGLTIKLKIQLLAVERALAGARILNGVTSAGYNQVIPNHPIENQVLNRNKQRTETT